MGDMKRDEDTGHADICPPPIRHRPIESPTHDPEADEPDERSIGWREEARPGRAPSGLRVENQRHPGEDIETHTHHEYDQAPPLRSRGDIQGHEKRPHNGDEPSCVLAKGQVAWDV